MSLCENNVPLVTPIDIITATDCLCILRRLHG